MDQQILNKTITISEVSTKQVKSGTKYILKDHEGKTFNFFTTKQDGTDTSAFAQFKNMELGIGSTVMIGYVEDTFPFQGKTVLTKKIINFRESNDQPTQTPLKAQTGRSGTNIASGGHSSDGVDWEELGLIKAHHNLAAARLAAGTDIKTVAGELPLYWNLCMEINRAVKRNVGEMRKGAFANSDANLVEMGKGNAWEKARSQFQEDLPVIRQDEDTSVEDIPF